MYWVLIRRPDGAGGGLGGAVDEGVGDELDAGGGHEVDAALDGLLVELHVGDAVHEQAADAVVRARRR